MRVEFDEKDAELLSARIARREEIPGPRIGDLCIWPAGWTERFSYFWNMDGGEIQTAYGGRFCLSADGGASFSGGLEPPISVRRLELLPETREAAFWFFHHDSPGAHRGVDVKAPCRVYRVLPPNGLTYNTPTGWPPEAWEASYYRNPDDAGSYLTPSREEAERVSTHWYMAGKASLGHLAVRQIILPK